MACRKIENNRRRLIRTMEQLGRFTQDQLLSAFRHERPPGDLVIDSEETVIAFLHRLRDTGVLDFRKGYYIIPRSTTRQL